MLVACFMLLMGCTAQDNSAPEGGFTTLDSLKGGRIGVTTGTIFDVAALKQWPDASLQYYDGSANLMTALMQDKIDAMILDEPVARQLELTTSTVAMIPDYLMADEYGFAFQKNADGDKLRSEFNDFMETAQNGKLLELLDEIWFGTDESKKLVEPADSLPATNGVVRFSSTMENVPFDYVKDGNPVGYEIDLIARFCKHAGYALEINTCAFGSLLPGLSSGRYDAVSGCMSITSERAKSVYFSDPIYKGGIVAVVLKDGSGAIVPVETARIGSITGTVCEDIANESFPDAKYGSFSDLGSCMIALKAGQLDYMVIDDVNALNYSRHDPAYSIYGEPLLAVGYSIGVNKGKPELLLKIDELLAKYEADGTLKDMRARWIEAASTDYIMPELPELKDAPKLNVTTCAIFEPMGFYQNGELVGFDIELAKRLAYDMGMRAEISDAAFTSVIPAVISGKADVVLSSLFPTTERRQEVNFTAEYCNVSVVLVRCDETAAASKGFFEELSDSFSSTFIVEDRWEMVLSGIGITLILAVCSGIVGVLAGFGLCLMRRSGKSAPRAVASAVTRVLQGTPIVVLLLIFYYIIFNKTSLDGIAVSIIAFGLNFGAYVSEIMLSGINAVDPGQREAAVAIGFSSGEAFTKIIFPQAARHFLPVLKGEYISLVKMTSIVGYVAVQDITKVSDIIRSRTYEAFFPLIATAVIYFIISFGLSSLLGLVEIRLDPKHRPRTLKGVKVK